MSWALPTRTASAFHAAVHAVKAERLANAAKRAAHRLHEEKQQRIAAAKLLEGSKQRFAAVQQLFPKPPDLTIELPMQVAKVPQTSSTPAAATVIHDELHRVC
jgi:hypothetical protein